MKFAALIALIGVVFATLYGGVVAVRSFRASMQVRLVRVE